MAVMIPHATPIDLAPLQRRMMEDSLTNPAAGHHVEQVEIRFASQVNHSGWLAAWKETVANTQALNLSYLHENGPRLFLSPIPQSMPVKILTSTPASWGIWREKQRTLPILIDQRLLWRVVASLENRCFLWTFHHALLDGRSIHRIMREFMNRVAGENAADLPLSQWHPPSANICKSGEKVFRERYGNMQTSLDPLDIDFPSYHVAERSLGTEVAQDLESLARVTQTSPTTFMIWAWGQALMELSGAPRIVVEQVRSGAPQVDRAGFTMALMPVIIERGGLDALKSLRYQLLSLRAIETMAPDDFPADVFPDVDGPWSSVIMVENASFAQQVGHKNLIESIALHEHKGQQLMAIAYLRPDLQLRVEGCRGEELLDRWRHWLLIMMATIKL